MWRLVGDPKMGKPTQSGLHDDTKSGSAPGMKTTHLSGEKKEIMADYNLRKEQLLHAEEVEQAITDDEKKELQERLNANVVYQAAHVQLAANEYDKTRKLEALKIAESKEREEKLKSGKGKYSNTERAQQIADEEKKQEAAQTNIKAALQKYYNDCEKITVDGIGKSQQI